MLSPDLNYEDYFPICYEMINIADAMIVIDGYITSRGVMKEVLYVWGNKKGMPIYLGINDFIKNKEYIK